MVEELGPEDFEEMEGSGETWIVDFWAEWCGPCEQYSPIFEDVSTEMEGVNFGKLDMEEHQQVGIDLGVRSLPTTMIIEDGDEVARKAGAMSETELRDFIDSEV